MMLDARTEDSQLVKKRRSLKRRAVFERLVTGTEAVNAGRAGRDSD